MTFLLQSVRVVVDLPFPVPTEIIEERNTSTPGSNLGLFSWERDSDNDHSEKNIVLDCHA
jgi:hypothetical protein